MYRLTIKPRGRGNWRTSEIFTDYAFCIPRETISMGGRLYMVVRIEKFKEVPLSSETGGAPCSLLPA